MPFITLPIATIFEGEVYTAGQKIKVELKDMEMFRSMGAIEVDGRSGKPKGKEQKEL